MSLESVLPVIRSTFKNLKIPTTHDKVYNDECAVSFDSPFSDDGLYVNVFTYFGYGKDYYLNNAMKSGSKLYLQMLWKQIPKANDTMKDPTKLAIGTDGGFSLEDKYDIVKTYNLIVINDDGNPITISYPNSELPDMLIQVLDGIINHQGMRTNLEQSSWDATLESLIISKYCESLIQLDTGKKISNDPKTWKCEKSGDTENLWLNLSTGYIGGGRKNWDGSGGSGAALDHYNDTGGLYPLCVKLGTITPHSADVYSYAPDENDLVKDTKLAEHLSHWGIDIMQLEKTDKSMGEMEVAMNQNYNWSKIAESDSELLPLSGPGYVGLRNIGSSCYMNSILQVLLSIPEIQDRYYTKSELIRNACTSDLTLDFGVQFSKLATALLSDRYIPKSNNDEIVIDNDKKSTHDAEAAGRKEQLEKYIIAPRMFKHVAARGHRDFKSGRQQDVSEYFLWLMEGLTNYEKTTSNIISSNQLFNIVAEERLQDTVTGEVRYKDIPEYSNLLQLTIPINKDKAMQESKKQKVEEKASIPFETCLEYFFNASDIEMKSPSTNENVLMKQTIKFHNFPRYLFIQLNRYAMNIDEGGWKQIKIDESVPVPESLDLSAYKATGLQAGEVLMPEVDTSATNNTATEVIPNPMIVEQLMTMGFSENGCKRACLATDNVDTERAMEWVFQHMEDSDFNDPPAPVSTTTSTGVEIDANMIESIQNMGFTYDQAKAALLTSNHNVEAGINWLLTTEGNLDEIVNKILIDATTGNTDLTSSDSEVNVNELIDPNSEGKYSLMGIVSHLGRNLDHGHYVCHIKKDGRWVLFNDEKVAESKAPPFDQGFVYIFRRNDGPGVF